MAGQWQADLFRILLGGLCGVKVPSQAVGLTVHH